MSRNLLCVYVNYNRQIDIQKNIVIIIMELLDYKGRSIFSP